MEPTAVLYPDSFTVREATILGKAMDNASSISIGMLIDVKQNLVDNEFYELLIEFIELERLHECSIPITT